LASRQSENCAGHESSTVAFTSLSTGGGSVKQLVLAGRYSIFTTGFASQ